MSTRTCPKCNGLCPAGDIVCPHCNYIGDQVDSGWAWTGVGVALLPIFIIWRFAGDLRGLLAIALYAGLSAAFAALRRRKP